MKPEKLFDKIEAAILEEPKRINMSNWAFSPALYNKRDLPACQTIGCIAGWAVAIARKLRGQALKDYFWDIEIDAMSLLKLDSIEASRLFGPANWPLKWRIRLGRHEPGTKAYAKVVVDYIHWWRKENRPVAKAVKSRKSHVMSTSGVGRKKKAKKHAS